MRKYLFATIVALFVGFTSCEKDPIDEIIDDNTIISAPTGTATDTLASTCTPTLSFEFLSDLEDVTTISEFVEVSRDTLSVATSIATTTLAITSQATITLTQTEVYEEIESGCSDNPIRTGVTSEVVYITETTTSTIVSETIDNPNYEAPVVEESNGGGSNDSSESNDSNETEAPANAGGNAIQPTPSQPAQPQPQPEVVVPATPPSEVVTPVVEVEEAEVPESETPSPVVEIETPEVPASEDDDSPVITYSNQTEESTELTHGDQNADGDTLDSISRTVTWTLVDGVVDTDATEYGEWTITNDVDPEPEVEYTIAYAGDTEAVVGDNVSISLNTDVQGGFTVEWDLRRGDDAEIQKAWKKGVQLAVITFEASSSHVDYTNGIQFRARIIKGGEEIAVGDFHKVIVTEPAVDCEYTQNVLNTSSTIGYQYGEFSAWEYDTENTSDQYITASRSRTKTEITTTYVEVEWIANDDSCEAKPNETLESTDSFQLDDDVETIDNFENPNYIAPLPKYDVLASFSYSGDLDNVNISGTPAVSGEYEEGTEINISVTISPKENFKITSVTGGNDLTITNDGTNYTVSYSFTVNSDITFNGGSVTIATESTYVCSTEMTWTSIPKQYEGKTFAVSIEGSNECGDTATKKLAWMAVSGNGYNWYSVDPFGVEEGSTTWDITLNGSDIDFSNTTIKYGNSSSNKTANTITLHSALSNGNEVVTTLNGYDLGIKKVGANTLRIVVKNKSGQEGLFIGDITGL